MRKAQTLISLLQDADSNVSFFAPARQRLLMALEVPARQPKISLAAQARFSLPGMPTGPLR
jgi:hypothetical protein